MAERKTDMATLLYIEINLFSIAVLLIIAFDSSEFDSNKPFKDKVFSLAAHFAALANIFDFVWEIRETRCWELPVGAVYGINAMYFLSLAAASYFWFLHSENVVKSRFFENRKRLMISALPIAALAVLLAVSYYTGWIFWLDDGMAYHRGPLMFLQQILSFGYIALSTVRCFVAARRKKNYVYRNEMMAAARFPIFPMICGLVQIVYQDVPFLTLGIAVSALRTYIKLLRAHISTDSLTGMYNRQIAVKILAAQISALKPDERLYFLFMDVDAFKRINDIHGHHEGDRALKAVASALKCVCAETKGICARYGGDEFVMIQTLGMEEDISLVKNKIHEALEEKCLEKAFAYQLKVSIGCAEYGDEFENIQDFIDYADGDMYKNKRKNKKT